MPKWTDEQLQAIEQEGKNIIVSAGAGSGKTAVLSERVIRKLNNGTNVDELLILTFTKAAAAEMKDRIRLKIKKQPGLKEQLDKIDNAYITTFDSYALSIVKKYNYLINVSKNVSIIEQSIIDIQKNKIMDSIFDELYKQKETGFLNLIDTFCTKDDLEIKRYIISISNKLDLLYNKEQYLTDYLNEYYCDTFINKKIQSYEEILLDKLSIINKQFIELEEYVDSEYYDKVKQSLEELIISDSYNSIRNNIAVLPQLPKNSDEEAKKAKEKITNNLKELKSLCIYKDKKEIRESIYKTKNYVKTIIDIILKFTKLIDEYKFNNDLYEFNDIAKMAIRIFDQNEYVRNEVKYSLKEILIDEYQDTSDLQDLFISYIANNNVYMVGDIKQSIYRFRNANPNLFKEKYNKYSQLDGGIKIDLNRNFRSREEVLVNINSIFDAIMDNKIGGAEYSKTHRMIFGNSSYNILGKMKHSNDLEIYNYNYDKTNEYTKEEIEIFIIANDIKNKIKNNYQIFDKDSGEKRDITYSDIVILMDRSTNFNLYKKIFEYLNIPLSIYKDSSINNSVDLNIIKNIINLLLTKEHNQKYKYSFVSILRSYLFNLDDNEIFKYFINENYADSQLINIINSINYDNLNPKELIVEIIQKFKIYEKIITVGDIDSHIAVLDFLVNIASSLTDMGYTIKDFYNYLEEIIENNYDITLPTEKEKDGVKIMTIHKSKGLEYHICYYSGLYAKFNTSDLKERFLYDNSLGIISPYFDNGIRQTIYKDLLKDKYMKEEISEKIRLFYVALTRAKEKMIIVAPLSFNDVNINGIVSDDLRLKYTSFLDILNSIENKLSTYVKNIEIASLNITKEYNFIKKNNYQDKIEKSDEMIKVQELNIKQQQIVEKHFSKEIHKLNTIEEQQNIQFGKNIHSIFENINFKNPNYAGLTEFEKQKIKSFVENDILKNVINIYKEYEFIYSVDNIQYHGFIDLLLEYENEFKIVDYKLKNIDDNAYLKQLDGYKNYLESITNKTVNIYLYSILDEKLKKL